MTLSALIKSATLTSINAALIPTALIGPSAVRLHLVLTGREIVIITRIVMEDFSVALTIVQVDQQEWTAAQMMVFKIFSSITHDVGVSKT